VRSQAAGRPEELLAIINEDVSMDVTTSAFSPTQMILAWTLLGLLLTWFITFTLLALRTFLTRKAEWEDLRPPSKSFPVIPVQLKQAQLQQTPLQYVRVNASGTLDEDANSGPPRDSGTARIM
jgi:hypothetical protein